MAFPPRLFIIGAQKAATSKLASLLECHPDIEIGRDKEIHFFSEFWDRGLDWYAGQFERTDARWLIDASPSYSAARTGGVDSPANHVAARIRETVDRPVFIYCLREPVARSYSSYWHGVRMGFEQRSLEEATTPPSEVLDMSNYAFQLERYLEHFSLDDFLLVRFEEIANQPKAVLARILNRLDLPQMALSDDDATAPKHSSFRFSGPMLVLRSIFPSEAAFRRFIRAAKHATPDFLEPMARRFAQKGIPPISDEDRRRMAAYFTPHNRHLSELTGLDLSDWEYSPP